MNERPQTPPPPPPRAGPQDGQPDGTAIPDVLPVLPVRDVVLYPQVVLPLAAVAPREIRLVNEAVMGDRIIAVVAVRDSKVETPGPEHLYGVGCAAAIVKMMKFPDETIRILVQGISRIRIEEYVQREPYLKARVQRLETIVEPSVELDALAKSAIEMFQRLVDLSPLLPDELKLAVLNIEDKSRLADILAATINLTLEQRQKILETLDLVARFRELNVHLNRDLAAAELSSKIQSQVRSDLEKDQRELILRRQLKAIQEELGETDAQTAEVADLRKRLKKLKLPDDARKEAERELDRLQRMPPQASEYHVARTYLDWILSLPWNKQTRDKLDIAEAERILNTDHYDLEKVKSRILEYLAVRKLKKDARGPILCFVGPPGTGKTSLGQSIARALGRKFVRISLGGVRDEAEIRGHRRTYVGALPGRIIQGLRKAESCNPVFMLDEVDKLTADFHGDPAAALLEVLDPEQNATFVDHYLDVQFDLSRVMFITTANVLDTIPPALLDRMEVLELPGYTLEEKLHIAEKYLVPRQLKENGLRPGDLELPRDVIEAIITQYTREAGLRNLERTIGTLCRKHAVTLARATGRRGRTGRKKRRIATSELAELLGPPRYQPEVAERTSEPGVATGLAWTPTGGEILFVESTRYAGSGKLVLTGKLGEVMKESAQAALSYVRSRADQFHIPPKSFSRADLHVHVPSGAIPKDGPSAGVTIAVSLISLLTGKPVRPDVAMTGEITLRGRILPVGGIKEKVLAAQRAGIKTIILPRRNEKDLPDVPETARKGMTFHFAETVDEVLPVVFDGSLRPSVGAKNPGRKAQSARRRKTTRR